MRPNDTAAITAPSERWLRLWCSAAVVCGGVACMEPARERAVEDTRVGHEERDGVRFDEARGRAVVRVLQVDELSLWASAPALRMTLCWQSEPPSELRVSIRNAIAGSELEVQRGGARIQGLESSLPTAREFALTALETDEDCLGLRLLPPRATEDRFRFAVLSDVQRALDRVQDVYRVINQQPELDFLLGAGDLTSQGTEDELELFQRELERLDIPYYTTLGNHELGTHDTNFHRYFGRGSQSFEYRGVRFTLLDSASALIDGMVEDWLSEWLASARDIGHVVAMHIPPLDPVGVRNGAFARRAEAAKLLGQLAQGNVDLTLYGHIHSYYHFENAGIDAHISGGGGAIPERFDDVGRHFLVVEATPSSQSFDVAVVRVD